MITGRACAAALACLLVATVPAGLAAQAAGRGGELHARAMQLEKAGNHPAALSLLWEAAGLSPDDPVILNDLGEALDRIGALDAAIDAFQRALDRRPASGTTARRLVLTLARAGRGPEAVSRARGLVAAAPGDAEALFTLGLALAEHDVGEAMQTFTRVLERDPKHTVARYNLALVLKRADRLDEAVEHLEGAIAVEPRPELYYTLGVIRSLQGDPDRAIAALRKAIRAEPQYVDAHQALGAALRSKRDWRGAAASLERAIAIRPELWGAHYTLGQVLQQAGDVAGARRHLAEADRLRVHAQQEQEAGVWSAVGIGRLERGDLPGAADCFRRAIQAADGYAPAYYQLGRVLQKLGRADESRAAFTRARELNPSLVPPDRH